jgi:hypothetical protein
MKRRKNERRVLKRKKKGDNKRRVLKRKEKGTF